VICEIYYGSFEGISVYKLCHRCVSFSGVGHGDDLIYLFDINSVDGKPLFGGELTDPHDVTVREHFTDLVAEFCRTGYVDDCFVGASL
jgi:hypothetical protein